MSKVLKVALCIVVLSCWMAGCAGPKSGSARCPCATGGSREQAPDLSAERLMLSEGYSLLYRDASNLDRTELILYAKVESTKVDEMVTAVAVLGSDLKAELERIARDYPGVRIDLDPLPEMEKRKRRAIGEDRARYFAPLIGHGGREYERTVLIGLVNGINHERHMCEVMAEAELDAGLKNFLLDAGKRYDVLHDRIAALLAAEYFRDPNGKAGN